MILTYPEVEKQVKYLHETGKIDTEKCQLWSSMIWRWERDCEYEIIEFLPGQWEMKVLPLLQNKY